MNSMKIFIQTNDPHEAEELHATGLIDGLDTRDNQLRSVGTSELLIDAFGFSSLAMHKAARELESIIGNSATIRIPMSTHGLLVCKQLSQQGIRTCVDYVYSIPQALLAAKAGASYVSVRVGDLDDQQVAGLEVVRGIAGLFAQKGVPTQVLANEIRNVHRAVRSFYNGASAVSITPSVFGDMYNHILTDTKLDSFGLIDLKRSSDDNLTLGELFS